MPKNRNRRGPHDVWSGFHVSRCDVILWRCIVGSRKCTFSMSHTRDRSKRWTTIYVDPLPVRIDINHWPTKNLLFLCAEGKDTRYPLFPGWNSVSVPQVAVRGDGRGDLRVLELVRVSRKKLILETEKWNVMKRTLFIFLLATSSRSSSLSWGKSHSSERSCLFRIFEGYVVW